jgi:hypothetical protein
MEFSIVGNKKIKLTLKTQTSRPRIPNTGRTYVKHFSSLRAEAAKERVTDCLKKISKKINSEKV